MNWDDLTAKAKAHWPLALLATLTVHLGYLVIVHVTNGAAAFFADDLGLLASIAVAPVRSMGPAATYVLIMATMSLCVLSLLGREIDNVPRRAIGLPLLLLGLSGILATTSEGRVSSGLLGDALEWGFASFAGSAAAMVICGAIFLYGLLLSRDWFFFDEIRTWLGAGRPAFANDTGLAPMPEESRAATPRPDVERRVAEDVGLSASRSMGMVDLSDFDQGDILPVGATEDDAAPSAKTAVAAPGAALDAPDDDQFLARLSEELDTIDSESADDAITAEVPIVDIEESDESDDTDLVLEGAGEELEFVDEIPDDTGEFEALVHDAPLDFSSLAELDDDESLTDSWSEDDLSVEGAPTVEEGGVLEMAAATPTEDLPEVEVTETPTAQDESAETEVLEIIEADLSEIPDDDESDEEDGTLDVDLEEVEEEDAAEDEEAEFDEELVALYASDDTTDDEMSDDAANAADDAPDDETLQVPTQQYLFGEGIESDAVDEDDEMTASAMVEEPASDDEVDEDEGFVAEADLDDDDDEDGFELIEFDGDEDDEDDEDEDVEYELVEVDADDEDEEDGEVEYEFVEEADEDDTDDEDGLEYELIEAEEPEADDEADELDEAEALEFELIEEDEEAVPVVEDEMLESDEVVRAEIEDDDTVDEDGAEETTSSLVSYAERASEIDTKPQPAPATDDWASWDDATAQGQPQAPAAAPTTRPAATPAAESTIPHEIYEAAVALCMEQSRCSVSILQRGLGLTFPLASECIERMEKEGLVGPYRGSGYREILRSPGEAATEEA